MKHIPVQQIVYLLSLSIITLIFSSLFSGCISSDLSGCKVIDDITITVEAQAVSGGPAPEVVGDIRLYLFDQNSAFVKCFVTKVGTDISIGKLVSGDFSIVVFGNADAEEMILPKEDIGKHIDEFFLTTKTTTLPSDEKRVSGLFPDLFWGEKKVIRSQLTGSKVTVPIHRRIGSVVVEVIGLKEHTGYNDNFSVSISEAYNNINFKGEYYGNKAWYLPASKFDSRDRLIVGEYILPASEEAITLGLYHNEDLLYSATSLENGDPLSVKAEKILNILINFSEDQSGEITITAELKDWDTHIIEK